MNLQRKRFKKQKFIELKYFSAHVNYTLATFNNKLANEPIKLKHSDFDRCSFEYNKDGKISCDWLQLSANEKPPFRIAQSVDKMFSKSKLDFSSGIETISRLERRFIVTDFPDNPVYLMSPVFYKNRGDDVRVSFFHAMTSQKQKIEVFLVPSSVVSAKNLPSSFMVVTSNQKSWQQSHGSINSSLEEFQVSF